MAATVDCKQCQKPFTIDGDNEPVLLFCGHSICSNCENTLLERDEESVPGNYAISCPICGVAHQYQERATFSYNAQKLNYQMKECMDQNKIIQDTLTQEKNRFQGYLCASCGYPMTESRAIVCLGCVKKPNVAVEQQQDTVVLAPNELEHFAIAQDGVWILSAELENALICGGCMLSQAHEGHNHTFYLKEKLDWKVEMMKKEIQRQVNKVHSIKQKNEFINANVDIKWNPLIEGLKSECDELKKSNTWAECEDQAKKILDNVQRIIDLRNALMTSMQGFCSDLKNIVDK